MARNFRRARQLHPIAELNVTNLIDLGFTLLIIFMIATPLINQEQTIRVDLPHASTLPQPKPDPKTKFQAITIDRTGRYFYGDSKTPVSFEELQSRLHELAGLPDDKRPVIRVRADLSLQYQKVVTLMDELAKNQLFKFSLDTQAVK
jgi:biopolymer transport protein ExbD